MNLEPSEEVESKHNLAKQGASACPEALKKLADMSDEVKSKEEELLATISSLWVLVADDQENYWQGESETNSVSVFAWNNGCNCLSLQMQNDLDIVTSSDEDCPENGGRKTERWRIRSNPYLSLRRSRWKLKRATKNCWLRSYTLGNKLWIRPRYICTLT